MLSLKGYGQDTLIRHDGTKVLSKVLEVGTREIKYRSAANPDGLLYIVRSNEINMIRYQNGITDTIHSVFFPTTALGESVDPNPPVFRSGLNYRQNDRHLKEKEMHQLLLKLNDPNINYHIKKAKFSRQMEDVAFVAIPAGIFAFGYSSVAFLFSASNERNYWPVTTSVLVAAAAITTSVTFKIKGKAHDDAALRIYNEKY